MNIKLKAEYLQELLEWDILYLEAKTVCYKRGWEEKIPALEESFERMKKELKKLYNA